MRFRLTVLGLALLLSATAEADLRIFDVGPHQQEVYRALANVLNPATVGGGSQTYGTVQQLPNGQLLVNAQPQALEQVEQVIEAIRERTVAAAPRVTLRYWAVLGARTTPSAANALGTAPPPILFDVLEELERLDRDLTFRVLGSAAVTTDSGQQGEVTADTMSVTQQAQVQGDALSAYLRIHVQGAPSLPNPNVQIQGIPRPTIGEIELRTTLRRGEFVVVGQSHYESGPLSGPVSYIVHWAE